MLLETAAAALVLAVVLWLLFGELVLGGRPALPPEPVDPEETRRGMALLALREIEFDRATGKLNDADYESLKARYTREAVEALREDEAAVATAPDNPEDMIAARLAVLRSARGPAAGAHACDRCGPRPELDASFCSSCGRPVGAPAACRRCGAALPDDSRFCPACGTALAA
ncbi:MAG TPA: zinc ribbon domain-containing protein [Gemmatimonadales bacterium]|nr:zinc ribbon domain-containing protein [Gemmatimonadales bacterium]